MGTNLTQKSDAPHYMRGIAMEVAGVEPASMDLRSRQLYVRSLRLLLSLQDGCPQTGHRSGEHFVYVTSP